MGQLIDELNRRISEIDELNQLNEIKVYFLNNLVQYLKDNKIEFNDLLYKTNLTYNNYDSFSILYINDFEDILIKNDINIFMFRYYHQYEIYYYNIYVDEIKRYIRQIKLKTIFEQ